MPKIDGVLETALYVEDLGRAADFHEQVIGLSPMFESETLRAYDAGSATVLLLFERGGSLKTQDLPGGTIPPHDGAGPAHMAFAVAREALPEWGAPARGRPLDRRTARLAERRKEHLFPRSGRPSSRAGDARPLGELLTVGNPSVEES